MIEKVEILEGDKMSESYQLTLDDVQRMAVINNMSEKTAYIDECGSFGFDFSLAGTSKYYILCAVVVDNAKIGELHAAIEGVKRTNGFQNAEMKSSKIGADNSRRSRIISQMLPIDFHVMLLIADKERFKESSPLTEYKTTFIKYLHQRLYDLLYHAYPKLKIIEDEIGTTEFQESFKQYVANRRPDYNLFNDYDFAYTDSKDELLVQLADMIGGSINRSLIDPSAPNFREMLKAKILGVDEFPTRNEPYWGAASPEDYKFDRDIYELSVKSAQDYVDKYQSEIDDEKKAQVAFLKYLLFQVNNNPTQFISSYQLVNFLQNYTGHNTTRNYLYRRIIAQLRDQGVLIASCPQGYKIPISVEDIVMYLNQTHTIVSPMLYRVGICRKLVLQSTMGRLDILNDPAFIKYKLYFD